MHVIPAGTGRYWLIHVIPAGTGRYWLIHAILAISRSQGWFHSWIWWWHLDLSRHSYQNYRNIPQIQHQIWSAVHQHVLHRPDDTRICRVFMYVCSQKWAFRNGMVVMRWNRTRGRAAVPSTEHSSSVCVTGRTHVETIVWRVLLYTTANMSITVVVYVFAVMTYNELWLLLIIRRVLLPPTGSASERVSAPCSRVELVCE